MKTFKDLSLEQRTQIGQYYTDGLEASAIAPLYGTDKKVINNVVHFLRKSGVVIPYKIARPVKKVKQELLVLPTNNDVVKAKILQRWSNSDKREAYKIYRESNIQAVMARFNTTEQKAYYLMQKGRKISGVKGKRQYTVKATPKPAVKQESNSESLGFFVIGAVVGAVLGAIF